MELIQASVRDAFTLAEAIGQGVLFVKAGGGFTRAVDGVAFASAAEALAAITGRKVAPQSSPPEPEEAPAAVPTPPAGKPQRANSGSKEEESAASWHSTACTCTASSRVGSMISAPTWCGRSGSSRRCRISKSGMRKARVLPEPVHACTAKGSPYRAKSSPCAGKCGTLHTQMQPLCIQMQPIWSEMQTHAVKCDLYATKCSLHPVKCSLHAASM